MQKQNAIKNPVNNVSTEPSYLEITFRFTRGDVPETAIISSRESEDAVGKKKTFDLSTKRGRRQCCFEICRLYNMAVVEACRWDTEEAADFLAERVLNILD